MGNNLQKEITDIKLKCYEDLENMNLQFKNLTKKLWNRSKLGNKTHNRLENCYENKVLNGLRENHNYCDQGEKIKHPEYFPVKIETNYKISLNGSQIFIPPVKHSNKVSDELHQCIQNVGQIRQFVKKVEVDIGYF